jgi:hypothetical protein
MDGRNLLLVIYLWNGLWGPAKLAIKNLIKKFEKDDLFGDYIAIFEFENLNIGCISDFFLKLDNI